MMVKRILLVHRSFICFACIGVVNSTIHGLILVGLVQFFLMGPTCANFFAFIAANITSYFLNSFFTFRKSIGFFRYFNFLMASLVALGITLVISEVAQYYHIYYLAGFAVIVLVVPVLNFLMLRVWAFRHDE